LRLELQRQSKLYLTARAQIRFAPGDGALGDFVPDTYGAGEQGGVSLSIEAGKELGRFVDDGENELIVQLGIVIAVNGERVFIVENGPVAVI
jgi:hypothetical protein